jgi:hypothetical protein
VILLELTQKEVDFLQEVIELEKVSVANSDARFAEKERKTGICDSFLDKVKLACKPKLDLMITSRELFGLISSAKEEYLRLPSNMHISNKEVEPNYYVHIAVANAMIMWLNGNGLLKQLAKFDYTDEASKYEAMEE